MTLILTLQNAERNKNILFQRLLKKNYRLFNAIKIEMCWIRFLHRMRNDREERERMRMKNKFQFYTVMVMQIPIHEQAAKLLLGFLHQKAKKLQFALKIKQFFSIIVRVQTRCKKRFKFENRFRIVEELLRRQIGKMIKAKGKKHKKIEKQLTMITTEIKY